MNKFLFLFFVLTSVVVPGCSQHERHSPEPWLVVEDDLKRKVTFEFPPRRIISLAPSITEILFALDSGATLVGVTDYCTYPPAAKQKQSVGGMILPNLERIAELRPELILVTVEGNSKEDFTKLESLGYRLFVINPRTLEDVFKSITSIGKIIGKDSSAASLVVHLKRRQANVLHLIEGRKFPSVFAIISLKPLMTASSGTFIDQLIEQAGGVNIASHAKVAYPIFNREEILHQQPDVILVMSDVAGSTKDLLREFPEWKKLPAFKNGKVYVVDADLLTRPGPRVIDGLEMLARLFHPDTVTH